MSEPTICAQCGKRVDMTISFSVPDGEPTPPLCMKCFRARTRQMRESLKRAKEAAE